MISERQKIAKLTILGLGLMGGSLARALKANNLVEHVCGWGRRSPSLERGLELGVIDSWTLDLAEAVKDATVVVICTPTLVAESVLRDLEPLLSGDTVLTDVASVKGNILSAAERVFGHLPENFVLGHPIAGSEQSGVDAARTDLFVDHRVILTPLASNNPEAVALVNAMWQCAGAEVVEMDVAQHDAVLAATSHLPHVLAYTLVDALAAEGAAADIFRFAAGGFRDFTRIASSDPQMWHDIVLANKAAVLAGIDKFSQHLAMVRTAIADEQGEQILTIFDRAKTARDEHFLGQYMKPAKPSKSSD
ncbi:prephenate dehydrogenase/arogenate dehydrogenase family protein [Spongiibacter pelagi]|uniref:prephenate dehydrogenase/arogenate dehydrogenase family protein n=1 Tax=Spongiibacter pelagi TaxID=2760804 RepID=UPI00295B6403|nr:prephenate dehydrogenase/arogenate dehydrogenase family protein [Spongiibacter pelagi]